MIELSEVPLSLAVSVEAAAWVLLAIRLVIVGPKYLRWRVPIAIVVGVALLHIGGAIKGTPPRTLVLMAVIGTASLGLTTVVRRGQWRRYVEIQERDGERSPELRKPARSLAFTFLGIAAVLMVIFPIIFKGAGI